MSQYNFVETDQVAAPVQKLKTNRSFVKFILLSIVTLGIYGLVEVMSIGIDLNTIVGRRDGKKTINYLLVALLLQNITCGIAGLVWYYSLSARIESEMKYRDIQYDFGTSTFWLWDILGTLILVGPFIYFYRLLKAMNLLCEDYNAKC